MKIYDAMIVIGLGVGFVGFLVAFIGLGIMITTDRPLRPSDFPKYEPRPQDGKIMLSPGH